MSGEAPRRAFRWQALLQGAAEAVFVLDRRRRLLFVNESFERLSGLTGERVRGLLCRRARSAVPDTLAEDVLAEALTPPPEALAGASARARRPWLVGAWWDVEFLPLRREDGFVIIGRAMPVMAERVAEAMLPERLVALRQRAAGRYGFDLLESRAPAMARLVRQVRLAIEARGPALIVGEAGAGKETAARIIHHLGRDRESAFAALDCERLPTDAVAGVLVESAGVGTIYLREPAALPRELQSLLSQRIETERPRIIAGSNLPVNESVRQGKMLAELANAISPLTLDVPPLRERKEDLPRLVERMLARLGATATLTPAAWEMLRGHAWPGNLAELLAALADCCERVPAGRIDANDVPSSIRIPARLGAEAGPAAKPLPLEATLAQVERRLIEVALRRARGNKARAAEALGLYRNQLARRMRALGMEEGEG